MKFTTVLAFVFVFVAASVSATPFRETNGERMARGLPPLPPQKRSGTPVYGAFWEGCLYVPMTDMLHSCQTDGSLELSWTMHHWTCSVLQFCWDRR